MSIRIKGALILSLGVLAILPAKGQDTSLQKIIALFKKAQTAMSKDSVLQFRVKYVYTNEHQPKKILDSLNGFFLIDGKHYHHSIIGNTESIGDDSLSVMLFRNDKIMLVDKAKHKNLNPMGQNPIDAMDTALAAVKGMSYGLEELPASYKATLIFPGNMMYKRIEFFISKRSNYTEKIVYIVKTEALVGKQPNTVNTFDKTVYEAYASVTATFYDYDNKIPEAVSFFNRNDYFIRDNNNVKPSDRYAGYKIYMASPNL